MQGLLGQYAFKSRRTRSEVCQNGDCRCYVYLMAVTEVMEAWPEQDKRQREWVRNEAGRVERIGSKSCGMCGRVNLRFEQVLSYFL